MSSIRVLLKAYRAVIIEKCPKALIFEIRKGPIVLLLHYIETYCWVSLLKLEKVKRLSPEQQKEMKEIQQALDDYEPKKLEQGRLSNLYGTDPTKKKWKKSRLEKEYDLKKGKTQAEKTAVGNILRAIKKREGKRSSREAAREAAARGGESQGGAAGEARSGAGGAAGGAKGEARGRAGRGFEKSARGGAQGAAARSRGEKRALFFAGGETRREGGEARGETVGEGVVVLSNIQESSVPPSRPWD